MEIIEEFVIGSIQVEPVKNRLRKCRFRTNSVSDVNTNPELAKNL